MAKGVNIRLFRKPNVVAFKRDLKKHNKKQTNT